MAKVLYCGLKVSEKMKENESRRRTIKWFKKERFLEPNKGAEIYYLDFVEKKIYIKECWFIDPYSILFLSWIFYWNDRCQLGVGLSVIKGK